MSIFIAIIIFSFIIIFHELGHFLLAKANGITVNEFCLGLGPKLIGKKIGDTVYSIRALPFGGACMMQGEDEENEEEGSFGSKSVLARISVVAAGPVFNFFLAFLLSLIIVGAYGYDPAQISGTIEGYEAEKAGLLAGDEIVSLNNKNIHLFREIGIYLSFHGDEPVTVTYRRDGELNSCVIEPSTGEEGYPMLGVTSVGYVKGNFLQTVKYSALEVKYWIDTTFQSLKALITGQVGLSGISGPVGIVSYIGDTYETTSKISRNAVISSLLNISILLTANLGVMNLLPIPALDGSRLVFLIVEGIRRKRVDPKREATIHLIGMAFLMALMVIVLFNDVWKLFV